MNTSDKKYTLKWVYNGAIQYIMEGKKSFILWKKEQLKKEAQFQKGRFLIENK